MKNPSAPIAIILFNVLILCTLACHPVHAQSGHGSLVQKSNDSESSIECTTPHMVPELHSPKPEAPDVLEAVKRLAKAAARGDADDYKQCLDNDCTVFDEETKKMLTGKDAAVSNMKRDFDSDGKVGHRRAVSIKIDQPFIKVAGKTAVVTYHAEKTVEGDTTLKQSAFVTQIFTKADDGWKLSSHTRGKWTADTAVK